MQTFNDLRAELKKKHLLNVTMMDIVGKLMAARDRKKLTQRDLSKIAGVPQKTISRIENGLDMPNLSTVLKLASALDLEITVTEKECDYNDRIVKI